MSGSDMDLWTTVTPQLPTRNSEEPWVSHPSSISKWILLNGGVSSTNRIRLSFNLRKSVLRCLGVKFCQCPLLMPKASDFSEALFPDVYSSHLSLFTDSTLREQHRVRHRLLVCAEGANKRDETHPRVG